MEHQDVVRKVMVHDQKDLARIEQSGHEGLSRMEGLLEHLCAASELRERLEARDLNGNLSGPSQGRKLREDGTKSSSVTNTQSRVGAEALDGLMDLVGQLALARNQIVQLNAEREDEALNAFSERLHLVTRELHEGVTKTRMQPIGMVWNKLPRVVRDLAAALGKQIRLEIDGAEMELDQTILEVIQSPLLHVVRNACEHGIEPPDVRARTGKPWQGKLILRASQEGGRVHIEIHDDGAGIAIASVKQKAVDRGVIRPQQAAMLTDEDALNLIFGAAKLATDVSGRGFGLELVKSHIEKIGGAIEVSSRSGEGTTVRLKIPLTLTSWPPLRQPL